MMIYISYIAYLPLRSGEKQYLDQDQDDHNDDISATDDLMIYAHDSAQV